MEQVVFTLVSDGGSDRVLMPVLQWLLKEHTDLPIDGQWAEMRTLRKVPRDLLKRIELALALFPCDLLFVHRDSEGQPPQARHDEIMRSLPEDRDSIAVPVVPVRMQEAWLLTDAQALRRAAGNPNGRMTIDLPELSRIESIPDPKEMLYALLRKASGRNKRRLKKFRPQRSAHLLARTVTDYSSLRRLPAFQRLEKDLVGAISRLDSPPVRV